MTWRAALAGALILAGLSLRLQWLQVRASVARRRQRHPPLEAIIATTGRHDRRKLPPRPVALATTVRAAAKGIN